jgi:hypothetical protein
MATELCRPHRDRPEDLETEVNGLRRELASVKLDNDLLIGPCRYRLQPVDVMNIGRDGTGSHQM